jgi:hypothetical protein
MRRLRAHRTDARAPETSRKDWWDRAGLISTFVSTVVIAAVGLLINSSIQRAQLQIQKTQSDATIARAESDKKLQEAALAAQLIQHLSSKSEAQRNLAIVALKSGVAQSIWEQVTTIVARSDADSGVRKTAIAQLSQSPNPLVAKALGEIARDPAKPEQERALADSASRQAAIQQVIPTVSDVQSFIALAAASPSTPAFESAEIGGGVFTHFLLRGLMGEADKDKDGRITGSELASYVRASVSDYTRQFRLAQAPTFAIAGGDLVFPRVRPKAAGVAAPEGLFPLLRSPVDDFSEVRVLAVGASGGIGAALPKLKFPGRDATAVADVFVRMGAKVTTLIDPSRRDLEVALERLPGSVSGGLIVVYLSGQAVVGEDGRTRLVVRDTSYDALRATGVDINDVRTTMQRSGAKGAALLLDACLGPSLISER